MKANDIGIEVVTNLADAPGWVDMTRNYLGFALARHAEATGQILDPEDQLRETVAQTDMHLGPEGRFVVARASGGEVVGIVLLHRLANGRGRDQATLRGAEGPPPRDRPAVDREA